MDDKEWGLKDVVCIGVFLVCILFGKFYEDKCMEIISGWIKYYLLYYNIIDGFVEMRILWFLML